MTDKPHVFISGPYSSEPVANTRQAMLWWATLHQAGYVPICPHVSLFQDFLTPLPYAEWLAYDLEILARCDALLRLDGHSQGADQEVAYAEWHGIPVFHLVAALERWRQERNA